MATPSLYEQYYKKYCFSLDARTFSAVRDDIFGYLRDEKCPSEYKLLFGEWLFKKIYMSYKPPTPVKKELCKQLSLAVEKHEEVVMKSGYLKWHDLCAMSYVAEHFYVNRFSDRDRYFVLQMLNDTQLVKNYLQDDRYSQEELKTHFLEWIKTVTIFEQQSNLLDVLLMYYGNDKQVVEVRERMRWKNGKPGSLFDDEQNVHDEDIQKSTHEAAEELITWYREEIVKERLINGKLVSKCLLPKPPGNPADYIANYVKSYFSSRDQNRIIDGVIQRVKIDTTGFGSKVTFVIFDVLCAIFHYIHYTEDVETKETLIQILMDEFTSMVELCSSGYVARLINVLHGFDERFQVTVSEEARMHAILTYEMSKRLEKAPEEVALGTFMEEHRKAYLGFAEDIINSKLPEIINNSTIDEVKLYIESVVKKLVNAKVILKDDGHYLRVKLE